MARRWMREQRTVCGEQYQEVDIYPICERQAKSSVRVKKAQASRESQVTLNARHARRYLVQLLAANFGPSDMHVTCTYADEHLPADPQAAGRDVVNFLRRVRARCKASGMGAPAYIAVTEWRTEGEDGKAVRYHHHVVLRCGLSRDEVESLWSRGGERLGRVNADRLQPDQGSLEALAGYLVKYTNRRRRWRQSRGLRKPARPRPNDSRWTGRKIENAVRCGDVYDRGYWQRQYPGWLLREAEAEYNEAWGEWHIVVKLWRPSPRAQGQRPSCGKKE